MRDFFIVLLIGLACSVFGFFVGYALCNKIAPYFPSSREVLDLYDHCGKNEDCIRGVALSVNHFMGR